MFNFQVIGNLGADAQVKESNGRKWVSFRVAHTERFTRADGQQVEETIWVSCALNGDGGGLLPYLVKGTQVYVEGNGSLNVYSSPKTKRFEAGAQLNVRNIQLIGGKTDTVPSRLFTNEGVEVPVYKCYYVVGDEFAGKQLQTPSGKLFDVNEQRFVNPHLDNPSGQSSNTNEENADEQIF